MKKYTIEPDIAVGAMSLRSGSLMPMLIGGLVLTVIGMFVARALS